MSNIFGDILDGIGGTGGRDSLKDAKGELSNINLPELQKYNPELYKQIITLNPELEQNVVLGPSATEGIALDPKYKQAQMQALQKMMDITSNNGQDAQFKADTARMQNDVNSNLQGNTSAIQQNMAMRGLSGGNSELVSKQLAAQSAANRQAQMGMDIQAQAQQRALQALMNQSNIGNQMSQTDFNQQNTRAQSQDAISKFNTQNLQNVNAANVQAKNDAQKYNAQTKQNIDNSNVDINNQSQQLNNDVRQKSFSNQMDLAKARSGIYQTQAELDEQRRTGNLNFAGGLISTGAKAYGK